MKGRTICAMVAAVLAIAVPLAAFGGTNVALADNGDPVVLGTSNYESSPSYVLMNSISTTSTREAAFAVGHQDDGNDVEPIAIWGNAGNSLFARPVGFQIGVFGTSEGDGVMGVASRNGVFGLTSNNSASGVYGENDGTGYGVAGRAAGGTGVLADSTNGTALRVTGRTKFSTAGTAVIASGQKKVTVTLAGVTATDFVLATVQGSGAFFVKNASAGSGQFTININKAPTAPATVTVAYFVISAS